MPTVRAALGDVALAPLPPDRAQARRVLLAIRAPLLRRLTDLRDQLPEELHRLCLTGGRLDEPRAQRRGRQ